MDDVDHKRERLKNRAEDGIIVLSLHSSDCPTPVGIGHHDHDLDASQHAVETTVLGTHLLRRLP